MSKKDKDNKKKKGKTYIFVDSENVGNLIPESLPKKTEVYFFLSDVNVYRKVYELLEDKHFHVVDLLKTATTRKREKNEMDLAIIAFIGNLIQSGIKKKDQYIILSYDKGYDRAMNMLVSQNPDLSLVREEMSLKQKIAGEPVVEDSKYKGELPKQPVLRKKALSAKNYDEFRSGLTLSQKKAVRQHMESGEDNGVCAWFEQDFFTGEYLLFSSGSMVGKFDCVESGAAAKAAILSKKKSKPQNRRQQKKKNQPAKLLA